MRKPFKAMIYTLIAVIVACAYLIWTPDKDPVRLNEKYAQPPSAFVKIRGARVHFRDSGPQNAPALIFLHGFGSSLHTWDTWSAKIGRAHV